MPRYLACSNSFPGMATLSMRTTRRGHFDISRSGPAKEGLVVYLILDDQRRVDVLKVMWVDWAVKLAEDK